MKDTTPLKVVPDDDSIISINDRKRLGQIQKTYPNIEIVIGKAEENDKPITVDLAEMENSRQKIFDAATESIMGSRIDRLERPVRFPLPMVTGIIGFLLGVASCFYALTI